MAIMLEGRVARLGPRSRWLSLACGVSLAFLGCAGLIWGQSEECTMEDIWAQSSVAVDDGGRQIPVLGLRAVPGRVPDTWIPFPDQRVVSESGRRYVVIKELKKACGIAFELCERAPGQPPMKAATRSRLREKPIDIDRDPKDRVIATGTVKQLPVGVLVPETIGGFLLFEQYYSVGYGRSVIYVDDTGKEKVSLELTQIFGTVPRKATLSVTSIWWNAGYWIDEVKPSIVLVAHGDELREVGIADGEITVPDLDRVLDWAATGTVAARALALEVLSRRWPDELEYVARLAVRIFEDPETAIALRLRAAVVLARAGIPVAAKDLFTMALAEGQPPAVRRYAAHHLPDVLGNDAMPALRALMRGKAGPLWGDCYQAFTKLGERAVPTLIEMLGEERESADYRGGAAHALAEIKSPKALDALLEATATAEDYVANAACNAAIATGSDDLAARLIAILARGSTQDGRIALFLQEHPTKAALTAIDAALARELDDTHRKWLQKAREVCAR